MDEGLVKYFIEETNKKFERLEGKVDQILKFKWQIIGGSLVVSVVCSLAISLAYIYFGVH